MMSKSVLFVLVALFAVQGFANVQQQQHIEHPQNYTLLEKLLEIIKQALVVIQKKVSEIVQTLPELLKELNEAALQATDNAEQLVQEALDDGLNHINELIEDAKEHGIDVKNCTVDKLLKLKEIGEEIVNDTASCVRTNVAQGDAALNLAIKQIQSINNAINVLQREFSDCGEDDSCKLDVLDKGVKLVQKLPGDIDNFIEQAKYKIQRIIQDFNLCLNKSQQNIQSKMKPLLKEIEVCIQESFGLKEMQPRDDKACGAIQTIIKLFDKLKNKVFEALDDLLTKVPDLVASLKETANKVLDGASEAAQNVANKVIEQIEKLIKLAEDKGISVAKCVGTIMDDIQSLTGEAVEGIKVCVANILNLAENGVNDAVNSANMTLEEVKQLDDDIQACGEDCTCYLNLVPKLGKAVVQIPLKIVAAFNKIQKLIFKASIDTGICLTKNTVALAQKLGPMANEVVTCIKDEIANNKN